MIQDKATTAPWQRSDLSSRRERVKKALEKRDGAKCVNCHETEGLHIDHAVPVVIGGSNDLDNLQLMCGACNRAKRTRIFNARFAKLCEAEPGLLALERECESFIPSKGKTASRFFYTHVKGRLVDLVGWGRPFPEMGEWRSRNPVRYLDCPRHGNSECECLRVLDTRGWGSASEPMPPLPPDFIFTSDAYDICYRHLSEILGGI